MDVVGLEFIRMVSLSIPQSCLCVRVYVCSFRVAIKYNKYSKWETIFVCSCVSCVMCVFFFVYMSDIELYSVIEDFGARGEPMDCWS